MERDQYRSSPRRAQAVAARTYGHRDSWSSRTQINNRNKRCLAEFPRNEHRYRRGHEEFGIRDRRANNRMNSFQRCGPCPWGKPALFRRASRIGINASVPRRDMHHEKAKQNGCGARSLRVELEDICDGPPIDDYQFALICNDLLLSIIAIFPSVRSVSCSMRFLRLPVNSGHDYTHFDRRVTPIGGPLSPVGSA